MTAPHAKSMSRNPAPTGASETRGPRSVGLAEGGAPLSCSRDNITSFGPITEEEAKEVKERFGPVEGPYPDNEATALWFRGEKTW